jgi:hypothetical protein
MAMAKRILKKISDREIDELVSKLFGRMEDRPGKTKPYCVPIYCTPFSTFGETCIKSYCHKSFRGDYSF